MHHFRRKIAPTALLALCWLSQASAQTTTVPDDCDGNGIPDVTIVGPSVGIWGGNYVGSSPGGIFNYGTTTTSNWKNAQGVVVGRPGTRTAAQVNLPSTLPSGGGLIEFTCSNAVATLTVSDSFARDTSLTFDLNGRTLVVGSELLALQQTGGRTLTGIFESGGLTSSKGLQFNTLSGSAWWWLRDCTVVAPSVSYADLRMIGGLLQTSAISGTSLELGGTTVDLPTGYDWTVSGTLRNWYGTSTIRTGTSGFLRTTSTSNLDIEAKLSFQGQIIVGGPLTILGTAVLPEEVAGSLVANGIEINPSASATAVTVPADLSGAYGTRSIPVLEADGQLKVRGSFLIQPRNGSEDSPQVGWSIPLAKGGTLVLPTLSVIKLSTPLADGHYLVPELQNSGRELSAKVQRGRFPTPTLLGNRDLTPYIRRSAPLNGGIRSRIAGISGSGTTNGQLHVLMRSASGTSGFDLQTTTTIGPDSRDVATGDLDGDGIDEIVVAFGAYTSGATSIPGRVIAYKVTSAGTVSTYWTHTLQSGQSANCVCVVPANSNLAGGGASLLPTSGTVGTGTGSSTGGSIKTLNGTSGTSTGETSTAETVNRIKGTDIDNDEDTDFTSSGTSSALVTPVGVIRILRRDNAGRYLPETPVSLPGIASDFAIDDIDGDGQVDLVAAVSPASRTSVPGSVPPVVLMQGIAGAFAPPQAITISQSLAEGLDVELLDTDEDGDLDIALAWWVYNSSTVGGTAIIPVQIGSAGITLGRQANAVSRPSHGVTVTPDGLASLATPASAGSSAVVLNGMTGSNVPGDLDGDGFINTADLALMLLDFGPCQGVPCPADLDATGSVDTADLALLLLLFE
jgi:hypothetical protein